MDPAPINLMDSGLYDNELSSHRLLGDMRPVIMGTGDPLVDPGLLASLGPGAQPQVLPDAALGHVSPYQQPQYAGAFTINRTASASPPQNGYGGLSKKRVPGCNREAGGLDDENFFETDVQDLLLRYPEKQLTIFDEIERVACGKAAKPGKPGEHPDQIVRFSVLRVQDSEDDMCASCKGPEAIVSNLDAPIRLAYCYACKKLKKSRMRATPNISSPTDDSVWNGFEVKVGYDPVYSHPAAGPNAPTLLRGRSSGAGSLQTMVTASGSKTLPEYLPRNWQRAADPEHFMPTAVAISGDYRLVARIFHPPATKQQKNPWRVLQISVVNDESVLHEIPLKPTAKVQLINFSYDGSLLLVCFHHGPDEVDRPRLVIWSMVTGMEVFRSGNEERKNIVAVSISRNMRHMYTVSLSDDSKTPSIHLVIDNLRLDATIQELTGSGLSVVPNAGLMAKVEYPKLLHPFTYVRDGAGYTSVILDEELKASPQLNEWLRVNNNRVPKIASMSEDGKVFAHVFESEGEQQRKGKQEVLLNEIPSEVAVKGDDFLTVKPHDNKVLVWDIERDELMHSFELQRAVTTVHVSANGTMLVVGMSGKVAGTTNPSDREEAYVIIYSLITRAELWRKDMPNDVDSISLKKGRLEFMLRKDASNQGPMTTTRYTTSTSEVVDVTLQALEGDVAVCGLQAQLGTKKSAKNPEEDDNPSSLSNLKKMAMDGNEDSDEDEEDSDEDEDEDEEDGNYKMTPAKGDGEASGISRLASMPRTQNSSNPAPPPVLIHTDLKATGPIQSISASDDMKWYVLKRNLAEHHKASCLTVGSIGRSGLRIQLHFALKLCNDDLNAQKKAQKMASKKGAAPETPLEEFVEISCICISSNGSTIALAIRNTTRVVVLSAVDLTVVWEFDCELVPHSMCINGETLTIQSDNVQVQSFAERQCSTEQFSIITKFVGAKSSQKCYGKTVGIAGDGHRRIVTLEDGTVNIEELKSGKILYSMQDHTKELMGTSANGELLIMREKKPRSEGYQEVDNIELSFISLPNFIAFGPSDNTCRSWKQSKDIEAILSPLKDSLENWILLDQPSKPQAGEMTRSSSRERAGSRERLESASKKAGGLSVLNTVKKQSAASGEGFGIGDLVAYMTHAKEFGALKLIIEACPVFWACYNYVEPGAYDGGKSYFAHALDSNDRILSQMLLDSVSDVVGEDGGKKTPVMQMTQVTDFVRKALEEGRMVDKVEEFLRDLPLIKIDETMTLPIFSRFPDGDVQSTAWNYRDVVTSADAWTFEEMEGRREELTGGGEGRERGYKYVAALPGLCNLEFIQPFVLAKASPGLVDNESMRAAIAVLERDLEEHYFGIACSTEYLVFMVCLACYCGYIELCVVVDDARVESLAKTHLGRLGLVLAFVAWACNVFLIYTEVRQYRHHLTYKTYLKAWTIIPWLSHCTCMMSYVFTITRAGSTAIRGTTAMGAVMLFLTIFVYVRSYRPMSSLVGMLIEIWKDMVLFCVVMLILICSFASGFYSLHGRVAEADVIDPDVYDNIFFGVGDSLVRTFMMSVLGDFSVTSLESQLADVDREALSFLSFFLFFVLAMLVSVVGMNALIAIMGDTYGRFADPSLEQAVLDKEIGSVLVDRLRLLTKEKKEVFEKRHRWIHVLSPSEKGSMPVGNAYGGGLITVKKEIKEMIESSSKYINGELRDIKEMKEAKPEKAEGRNKEEEERWMRQIEEIRKGYKEKQKILEKKHKVREEDLKRMAEYAEQGSLSKIAASMDLLFQQIEGIEYYIRTNGVSRPPQPHAPQFDVSSAHQFRAPDESDMRSRLARNASELPR